MTDHNSHPVYSVGAEADAKAPMEGIPEAARSFMELFVAESGDERFLTVEDIDHNELANRYEALELALAAPARPYPVAWQTMDSAPLDKTPVIIAVPTKDQDDFIVGEAYFDPEHYDDGDWWWAGTNWGDYHAGPVSEMNYHGPMFWQPLPSAPIRSALIGGEAKEAE